jgi:transcriptional regulator of acetoin/glycerol metabolism
VIPQIRHLDNFSARLRGARASRPARALADKAADLRLQEARTLSRVVQVCRGKLSEAARRMGISCNTLYLRLGRGATA